MDCDVQVVRVLTPPDLIAERTRTTRGPGWDLQTALDQAATHEPIQDQTVELVSNGWVTRGFQFQVRTYRGNMYTIELQPEELRLLRSALGSYLQAFGHNEADVVQAAKTLLLKLPEPVEVKAS